MRGSLPTATCPATGPLGPRSHTGAQARAAMGSRCPAQRRKSRCQPSRIQAGPLFRSATSLFFWPHVWGELVPIFSIFAIAPATPRSARSAGRGGRGRAPPGSPPPSWILASSAPVNGIRCAAASASRAKAGRAVRARSGYEPNAKVAGVAGSTGGPQNHAAAPGCDLLEPQFAGRCARRRGDGFRFSWALARIGGVGFWRSKRRETRESPQ